MCLKCENMGIDMSLSPLNVDQINGVSLPKAWDALILDNFHQDLLLRARAHMLWSLRKEDERIIGNAKAFLSAMAKGFIKPFDRQQFEPENTDPYFKLKTSALNALEELSDFFGNRVSSVTWDSLAHISTRDEPEVKQSILKEASGGKLPHHYGVIDTQLHAIGKVYTFAQYMQSVFFKHTGMILVHNCDCDCSLLNMQPIQGVIRFDLNQNQIFEATQSLFTHQLAESHLILNEKLPFEYTITKEAQEILGLA